MRGRAWVRAYPIRAYLATKGTAFTLIGVTWGAFPSRARELGIGWSPFLTEKGVAVAWIIAGAIAVTAAVRPSSRLRRAGFFAIQAVSLSLAAVFAVSAVLGVIPWVDGGRPESIITTVSYLAFWASAAVVAQIQPEPDGSADG